MRWPFQKKVEPQSVKTTKKRSFSAAKVDRLTQSWITQPTRIDADLYKDGPTLIARVRDLVQNDDYARRFAGLVRTNVVGSEGIVMRATVPSSRQAGQIDQPASDALLSGWAMWGRSGTCDLTETLSWISVLQLASVGLLTEGEAIIRHRDDLDTKYGYGVELLDPVQLDHTLSKELPNGNYIVMGVEMTRDRRPIAYHFAPAPIDPRFPRASYQRQSHTVVPASEIIHAFIPERIHQSRGFSAMATSAKGLRMRGGYEEAALIQARMGAAQMGWFKMREQTALDQLADSEAGEAGELYMDAEPGAFRQLPPEIEGVETFNPDQPSGQFDPFVKRILRGVGAGLGVSFESLANDREGVNYSSIRSGVLEDREIWKACQGFMIDKIVRPVYERWLDAQLLRETIRVNEKPLNILSVDRYRTVEWQGRRWPWVDPKKDAEAAVIEIGASLTTRGDVIRERGKDPQKVWRELGTENQLLESLGISTAMIPVAPPATPIGDDDATGS